MEISERSSLDKSSDLLIVCSYYYPYISGITVIATEIAEYIASQGIKVTVLCHQHDSLLSNDEIINNVRVVRARKLISINRANISFDYIIQYLKLVTPRTRINLHLPLPEAGLLSLIKRNRKVTVYQCDVDNKNGVMRFLSKLMDLSSIICFIKSEKVIYTSLDYAKHSRLFKFVRKKIEVIPNFTTYKSSGKSLFRDGGGRHFGFLGRFTSEKGIIILIKAFMSLNDSSARLIIAGSSKIAGDSVLEEAQKLAKIDSRIKVLLDLDDISKANFFASIDVLCLPSTNSFEAFGIVQLEALFCGIPVIVSDLPGVRTFVQGKDFGILVKPGSVSSLEVALKNNDLRKPNSLEIEELRNIYSPQNILEKYRDILF
jgi:glycosyltransferase involved in cell wall biosynthesis